MIQAKDITKIYHSGTVETVALQDVSFEIQKGEFVAIMGPSGSGKSTLMHILGALDQPTSGEYILDGVKIGTLSDDQLAEIRNQKIGFVFQFYNLLPRTTALKNVTLPMMYANLSRSQRVGKATTLMEKVGLSDRLYHTPNQLSGGQQQRVAIARALAMDPSIVLADEPTGNIATTQAEEIMRVFQELNRQGHTMVMITHDSGLTRFARRTILIRDGKLVGDTANCSRRKKKESFERGQGPGYSQPHSLEKPSQD